MELKDLVGLHTLDAVDYSTEKIEPYEGADYFEDSQRMVFRLDGVAYMAIEDPNDGYRSSMKELVIIPKARMKNVFKKVKVVGKYKNKNGYNSADILELIDIKNGEVVLEVGTDNDDDYYPSFVASFVPENMSINSHIVATPLSEQT